MRWSIAALISVVQYVYGHGLHATSLEDLFSSKPREIDLSPVELVDISSSEPLSMDLPFPESIQVHLRAHGHDLSFVANLKHDLFTPETYVHAHDGPEKALLKMHEPKNNAYSASLPNGGYVRLAILGHKTFHATIKLDNEKMLVIDPVEHHKGISHRKLRSSSTGHVSYLLSLDHVQLPHHRQLSQWGRMAACSWTPKQMSVGVASDAGFTAEHGGVEKTQSYLTAVYNSINGLYDDQVGVHLVLGAFLIETSVGGPSWNVAPGSCGAMTKMQNQLDAAKAWVASSAEPLCNQESCGLWHVHTNCDADPSKDKSDNTAGLAWVGTLCSSTMGYNTGVSIDAGAHTWIIVGHELGHNFGASHTFNEGGIMSYDWNTPMKFYDNGQVCNFVSSVLNKCMKEYKPSSPTTTTPQPTTTTPKPTTSTPQTTTTTTPVPSTTTSTTTSPQTSPSSTVSPAPTESPQDPCSCATENLCSQLNRPGCQSFLGKKYCYVVGYDRCKQALPSSSCTDARGKRLYYLEFNGDCPKPSSTQPPTTTLQPVETSPAPTTKEPDSPIPTTTEANTTAAPDTPTTTAPDNSTTTAPDNSTTTAVPSTDPPQNSTTLAPTTNTTNSTSKPPVDTSDPCSCSTTSKCPTIPGGGCRAFNGKGWCYVKDPHKCFGASYHDSMDCVGQKYTQCDPKTNKTISSIPKDPCACSSAPKCPIVTSQPGCFQSGDANFCYVEDPQRCHGTGIRSSVACPNQKLKQCSKPDASATHWVVSEWSKCSVECGGGIKTRKAVCMDRLNIITFTDTSCSAPKPTTKLQCNLRSCPTSVFNNTTPCAGPPHSTCKPRRRKRFCDCACNKGYVYHPRRRECIRLPDAEFQRIKCPECSGNVYGVNSFEVRSHDIDRIDPIVCNGRESSDSGVSTSWLAAFDPQDTSQDPIKDGANIALIVIATCIAAVAFVLVVIAYRRRNSLEPVSQVQTPVYIVGATPSAML